MPFKALPFTDRIAKDERTDCWIWTGSKTFKGYGTMRYLGKVVMAHRFAAFYWLRHQLDNPLLVMHRCDNPSCVNPKHLFIGTHSDNQRDSVAKRRQWQSKKTHCPQGHPYDETNTYYKKRGGRDCRICQRAAREKRKLA